MPKQIQQPSALNFGPNGAEINLTRTTAPIWFGRLKTAGVFVEYGRATVIPYSPFNLELIKDYINANKIDTATLPLDWEGKFAVAPRRIAYGEQTANGNYFLFACDKNDPAVDAIRALSKREWLPNAKQWLAYVTHRTVPELARLFSEYPFEGGNDYAKTLMANVDRINEEIPTNLRVKVNGLTLKIDFPYDVKWSFHLNKLSAHHKVNNNTYSAPVSPENVKLLQELGDALKAKLPEKEMADALAIFHANLEFSGYTTSTYSPPVAHDLFPFQRAGVEYAVRAKRCIIGDAPGLGKTAQAIAWLAGIGEFPAIIVAQPSLLNMWRDHVRSWLPNKTVSIVRGTKSKPNDYMTDIVIVGYSTIAPRLEDIKAHFKPKAIVWDEAHMIRTSKRKAGKYTVKRVQASKELAEGLDYRLMLSGTPMNISPMDFCTLLDILGYLETDFGGYYQFAAEFADAHMGSFGMTQGTVSVEALHRLNRLMRSRCYVRREKEQVLPQLPNKLRSVINFPLTNRAHYDRAVADVVKYCTDMVDHDQAFLAAIAPYDVVTQQRMITERKKDVSYQKAKAEQLVKINVLKKLAVMGKLEPFFEWVDSFLESGNDKLIIFAHHKDVQAMIYDRYMDQAARMFANDKPDVQTAETYAFQNDPTKRIMVASDIVGREGHTWTAATHVAFVELGWTSTAHEQCEDRAHRIGQKNAVNVYYFLGEESIDQDIYQLLQTREVAVKAATNGDSVEAVNQSIMKSLLQRLGVDTSKLL